MGILHYTHDERYCQYFIIVRMSRFQGEQNEDSIFLWKIMFDVQRDLSSYQKNIETATKYSAGMSTSRNNSNATQALLFQGKSK